jgi:anti-anti-sigma factor
MRPEELILHLNGQLDGTTALTFRDIVFTAMGERPLTLVLDLTGISVLDAAGVTALVTASRVSRLVRQDLGIRPSPRIARMLTETGLNRLFTVEPDALAA